MMSSVRMVVDVVHPARPPTLILARGPSDGKSGGISPDSVRWKHFGGFSDCDELPLSQRRERDTGGDV